MLGIIISAVSSLAVKAISIIGHMGLAIKTLDLIGRILVSVAKALGLIENKVIEAEELGYKALQAESEGIKPENYKTYVEYVKAIEEFELDPKKSNLWTDEEKIYKGIELSSALLIEKYGPEIQELILEVATSPEFFNSQRLKAYIDVFAGNNLGYGDITDYLSGNIRNIESRSRINNVMLEIEKRIDPEISTADAQKLINSQKR